MSATPESGQSPVRLPTRKLTPEMLERLRRLTPGQRLRITQTVRCGKEQWETTVEGVFRELNYLATGLSTDRRPADDLVVPMIHFTKDNGELSSISLDERSRVEIL